MFTPGAEKDRAKVAVGYRPNGLAYNPGRHMVLAANVGDPTVPQSTTVSIVDVERKSMVVSVSMPGHTRRAIFDGVILPRLTPFTEITLPEFWSSFDCAG